MTRYVIILLSVFGFSFLGCGDDTTNVDGSLPDVPTSDAGAELCTNTCGSSSAPGEWANDGECDDGGDGSANDACTFGTDCGDCGSRSAIDAPDAGTPDAGRTYPAVCQNLAMSCPDAASLDACEAGTAGFAPCTYLPLTVGCVASSCPSNAQLCRELEHPDGYCTHPCSTNEDCAIDGGGLGECQEIAPGLDMCLLPN